MLKKLVLFFLLIFQFSFNAQALTNEFPRHSVSVLAGMYSFSSPTSSLSGVGSFDMEYAYRFTHKWSGHFGLNNILSSTFNSLIWGIDLGGNYCLVNCQQDIEKIDNIIDIVEYKRWGFEVGGGMTLRNLQLVNSSIFYSGPFIRLDTFYFKSEQFKYIGRVQYSNLLASTKTLTILTMALGISFDY